MLFLLVTFNIPLDQCPAPVKFASLWSGTRTYNKRKLWFSGFCCHVHRYPTGSRFTLPVPGSRTRVADPHHIDADPDPACRFDADPDPDPACHFDANPDPDPCFQIKAQNLEKVLM
jgi:hypothetical protein